MKLSTRLGFIALFVGMFAMLAAAQGSSQSSSASKTEQFASVPATDESVKSAIDAHDLKAAAALVGKTGSFTGTVTKLYSPKSGSLVILNFDRDFKTALTAVVKKERFSKFPDLTQLEGKKVLVTGKFIDFKGATEIELSEPGSIKLIGK